MSKKTISTKLTIEGEGEYKRLLLNINSALGVFKSELSKVKAECAGSANQLDALRAKEAALKQVQDEANKKVEASKTILEAAKQAQAGYAEKVEECRARLEKAEKALSDYGESGEKSQKKLGQLTEEIAKQRAALDAAEKVNEEAQRTVNKYQKAVNDAERDLTKYTKQLDENKKYMDEAKRSTDGCATSIDAFGKKTKAAEQNAKMTQDAVVGLSTALGAAGLKAGFEAAKAAIEACLEASISFESTMAGVRRTVGGTDAEISAFADTFKQLATQMPISTTELGNIATTAGQLGIARDKVENFAKVMAMLATTTDLTADSAATMLAQFANITGLTDYDRLGATIAELGDATATTASKVVEMSQGMAAAADMAGFRETEILGLSAAVGSLGIEAQAGSTAMSTLISTLYKSVETGGDKLNQFAAVAGMSGKEFAEAWRKDAAGAFTSFIEGLSKNEKSAVVLLDELGITNVRQTRAILGLANAGDLLSNTMAQANRAWEENTALQEKASIMYETTEAKVTMCSNAFNNLKIAVGDELNPAIGELAESGKNVLDWAAEFVEANGWLVDVLAGVTAGVGAFVAGVSGLVILNKVIPLIASLTAGLAAVPGVAVAAAITGVVVALGAMSAKMEHADEQTRDMVKSFRESRETYNETTRAIASQSAETENMITALASLAGAENKTAAEKKTLLSMVDQLNKAIPNLNLAYDEQADKLSLTTEQLMAYVEALASQQEAEGIVARLVELQSQRVQLTKDLADAQDDLAQKQAAYTAATEGATDAMLAMGYATGEGWNLANASERVRQLTQEMEANQAEAKELHERYGELSVQTAASEEATAGAVETAEKATRSYAGLADILQETETAYGLLSKAQIECSDTGYLTLDTVKKFMDSGLEGYLEEVEGGYRLTAGALEDYMTTQKAEHSIALSEAKAAALAIISHNQDEASAIDNTTEAIKRKLKAMQAEAQAAVNVYAGSDQAWHGSIRGTMQWLESQSGYREAKANLDSYTQALKDLEAAEKNTATFDRVAASLSRDYASKTTKTSKSSSSGKSSTSAIKTTQEKTHAELELEAWKTAVAELDHKRAMDEVSTEEYYRRKRELANKHLQNNQAEREKWDEELHKYQKGEYDRQLADLNAAHEAERITTEEYFAKRLELQDKFYSQTSDEWVTAEKKRTQDQAKANKDAFDEEKADKQYFYRMGIISEEEYYAELVRLRDDYLEENSDAWRSATLEIHDWIEKKEKERTEALEAEYKQRVADLDAALKDELAKLKDAYNEQKALAKDAYDTQRNTVKATYQAQKEAAKEAYQAQKQQIKDNLEAEKERLNTVIAGIDKEIEARKRLREDENQDDAIGKARKRLEAAKTQRDYARTDEDRAQWEKEIIRRQQELDEAVQNKEDTAFYRRKDEEKDTIRSQINVAEKTAGEALTKAESDYNVKVKQIEAEYDASLTRIESEYKAALSRLESDYNASVQEANSRHDSAVAGLFGSYGSSGGSGSSGGGKKIYSDQVKAIAKANNVDLSVAESMLSANRRAILEGRTPEYSTGGYNEAKSAAESAAKAMGEVASTVVKIVAGATQSITKNSSVNMTFNQASSLTSGQISAALDKALKKMSR